MPLGISGVDFRVNLGGFAPRVNRRLTADACVHDNDEAKLN